MQGRKFQTSLSLDAMQRNDTATLNYDIGFALKLCNQVCASGYQPQTAQILQKRLETLSKRLGVALNAQFQERVLTNFTKISGIVDATKTLPEFIDMLMIAMLLLETPDIWAHVDPVLCSMQPDSTFKMQPRDLLSYALAVVLSSVPEAVPNLQTWQTFVLKNKDLF